LDDTNWNVGDIRRIPFFFFRKMVLRRRAAVELPVSVRRFVARCGVLESGAKSQLVFVHLFFGRERLGAWRGLSVLDAGSAAKRRS
jgi:hypothetical protein